MIHRKNHLLGRLRNTNPTDVVVGVIATLAVDAILLSTTPDVVLRTIVALPLLLFLPGYFVVGALFPGGSTYYSPMPWHANQPDEEQIDLFERLSLSYGVSLGLLPVVALLLSVTPWGVTLTTVVASLSAVVLFSAPMVVAHRAALPADETFEFPFRSWLSSAMNGVTGDSFADAAVNVGLAVIVIGALAATGGVILFPQVQSDYTELAVLTENAQGELVADAYPDTIEPGESVPLVLSVQNEGDRAESYVVVAQIQRVGEDGEVLERKRVERFREDVPAGETWRVEHDVSTSLVGERLRLSYLLYEGAPPATPTRANADKAVHIWLSSSG